MLKFKMMPLIISITPSDLVKCLWCIPFSSIFNLLMDPNRSSSTSLKQMISTFQNIPNDIAGPVWFVIKQWPYMTSLFVYVDAWESCTQGQFTHEPRAVTMKLWEPKRKCPRGPYGHFTHKTKSPWPLHFKQSHWWKRRRWSKLALHHACGASGVCMWMQDGCEVYVDSYMALKWIMFHLDYFQYPPLGGRHNTKPGDHGTSNIIVNLFQFIMCGDPPE